MNKYTQMIRIRRILMHKLFVKTRNVKDFIGLMNNLIDKSSEASKMGLVYGDPGLGKTQTAVWQATKNDAIYIRAQNKISSRWLLEKIVCELGESPSRKMSDLIDQCLKQNIPIAYIQKSIGCYGLVNFVKIYRNLLENFEKDYYNPLQKLNLPSDDF